MRDISAGRDETFRRLYHENFDALLGYALRRTARPEDAADVVADTFLVAWRRQRDVPPGEQARLWLYGVARRTLANQRRGDVRRTHLGERLGADLALVVPDLADDVTTHHLLHQALDRLATGTARCSSCPSGRASSPARSRWCSEPQPSPREPDSPGPDPGCAAHSVTIRDSADMSPVTIRHS